jgi:hypothetical protein
MISSTFNGNPARPRKCECGCGARFVPQRSFQTWATYDCGVKVAMARQEKAERKALKARKEAARPLRWFLNKARAAVHAYIRERDALEPCISCGQWHAGQWHAGHFNSVGSHPELRFEYDNIHKQCQPCNAHKGGNRAGYEPRLIAKIGKSRVDWLNGPHPAAKFTREDLLAIEADAKARLKALNSERERKAA